MSLDAAVNPLAEMGQSQNPLAGMDLKKTATRQLHGRSIRATATATGRGGGGGGGPLGGVDSRVRGAVRSRRSKAHPGSSHDGTRRVTAGRRVVLVRRSRRAGRIERSRGGRPPSRLAQMIRRYQEAVSRGSPNEELLRNIANMISTQDVLLTSTAEGPLRSIPNPLSPTSVTSEESLRKIKTALLHPSFRVTATRLERRLAEIEKRIDHKEAPSGRAFTQSVLGVIVLASLVLSVLLPVGAPIFGTIGAIAGVAYGVMVAYDECKQGTTNTAVVPSLEEVLEAEMEREEFAMSYGS